MKTRKYSFETPDARKVVIRRMDNPEIEDVADACKCVSSKRSFSVVKAFWKLHYVMTVEAGNDEIHLVITLFPEELQDFLSYIKANGMTNLANAPGLKHPFTTLAVYHKNAYSAREEAGEILIKAVELNVQPNILALIGKQL